MKYNYIVIKSIQCNQYVGIRFVLDHYGTINLQNITNNFHTEVHQSSVKVAFSFDLMEVYEV